MSAESDVNRIVRTWLEDGVMVLPERVLDQVLDQVPSTRQERRGFAAWRNPSVSNVLKLAIAAAAVVAVVVGGMNLIQQSGDSVGVPLQSDAPVVVPSAVPSASPVQSPAASSANDIERHQMRASGSDLTFTVEKPEIWSGFSDVPNEPDFAIIRRSTAAPTGMSVYFYAPTTTYSDPCRQVPVDPPVGPTVEDLVEALRRDG